MESVRQSVVLKREFAKSIVAGCGSGLRVTEFAFLRDARCKFRPEFLLSVLLLIIELSILSDN